MMMDSISGDSRVASNSYREGKFNETLIPPRLLPNDLQCIQKIVRYVFTNYNRLTMGRVTR